VERLILTVSPLALLLAFGCVLRHIHYFDHGQIQKIIAFTGDFLIPCVIFNTVLNLEIRGEHIVLSAAFFALLVVLLLLSWLAYRILSIKRRFFIFFSCAFAFGLMGIPLFSTVFGAEHMDYLVALGVGHELFFATVYLTALKLVLKGEKFSGRNSLRSLFSPLFCMVLAALALNLSGGRDILEASLPGMCLLSAISELASITTVLTMIVVGYQLHFENVENLRESVCYVLFRYALSFGVGYTVKWLLLDRWIRPSPYFDHAYFTMLSQFGSTMLIILVGKYCSREDLEVSSNAFVLNVAAGIVLYAVYAYCVGL